MFARPAALSSLSAVICANPINPCTTHHPLLNRIARHNFRQSARQKYDTPQLAGFRQCPQQIEDGEDLGEQDKA